jgi:polyvinyl alcohol dehydrogenase (cytochrome)
MRTLQAIGLALISFTITLAIFQLSGPALAQQPATPPALERELALRATEGAGATVFGNVCGSCHGIQGTNDAMSQDMLKQLTPEKLYESMTTGTMRKHADAEKLTDEQRVAIAEWVSGRRLGSTASGGAETMPNKCATSPPVTNLSAPSWNGWSPDMTKNNRYQTAKAAGGLGPRESGATEDLRRHGFSPAAVARLELKWAFGLPWTSSAYGQPTVVDGRVFIGSDSGYLYSLDADTGCVHWSFQAQAGLRSTPTIAVVKRGAPQTAAFFGDIRGNAYAVDASSGKLLWKTRVDAHPLARITAGLTVHEGRVYVPVASLEEPESASFNYACCTIRGLVAVLDTSTGKQIWKSYTIPEEPSERKNDAGVKFLGPSGAGIWGPVTIDPKRQAVYVSTGNAFSAPDLGRSNAVMAMDINTGKVLWVTQAMHGDVWHTGCAQGPSSAGHPPRSAHRRPGVPLPPPRAGGPARGRPAGYYCPDEKDNPDWDFSAGTILVDRPGGGSLVLAGQKSGGVWALDPDNKGKVVWYSDISRGQILFGGAADEEQAYFAMRGAYGGLVAVRLKDGLEQWFADIPPQESMAQHTGISAAVSVMPGTVFSAGLDGMLRAFSTSNGRPIWEYNTAKDFETVNGVKARGGSIGSAGATIVNGMVYVTSGYTGFQNGRPGNVLLAFSQPRE